MNPNTPTPTPAPVVPVDPNAAATTPVAATTPAATPIDMNQFITTPKPTGGVAPAGATPPPYSPNVVNQTVDYGGVTWKGNPGASWQPATLTGGGALPGAMGGQPTIDLVGATNALYNTPEIQAANKAISDRQQALANATANINDNPFYADASRTGQLSKLQTNANNDITVQQNILAGLKADAAIKINALQGQYNINETNYQNQLTQFQNLISMGGLDNMNPTDLAGIAQATGIPMSMLSSIQQVAQAKNTAATKPQIVTSTNSAGDLTIASVDPSTGAIIGTTTINGAGKGTYYKGNLVNDGTSGTGGGGSSNGGGGGTSTADTKANLANLVTDVKNKVTLKSLVDHYGQVLTPKQILDTYNGNSPWGKATETVSDINQGNYADQ